LEGELRVEPALHFRSYTIIHQLWKGNQYVQQPARWTVLSSKHPGGLPFNKEDLRDLTMAECVQRDLENYPQDMIERLLAEGHPLA
jgi:hypothetical protein